MQRTSKHFFEDDPFEMISSIKYKPVNNQFQNKLKEDCQEIRKSNEVMVSADKTSNQYIFPPEEYKRKGPQRILEEQIVD